MSSHRLVSWPLVACMSCTKRGVELMCSNQVTGKQRLTRELGGVNTLLVLAICVSNANLCGGEGRGSG